MLLEVSAYPKPGNVHRTRGHTETRFEHFLASAAASGPHFERAAERGVLISMGRISYHSARVGSTIRDAVICTMRSQRGGNTSLGTLTLLVPLAVAAGMTLTHRTFSLPSLRRNLRRILRSTTAADAVALYEAVEHAKPAGLGTAPEFDVKDSSSKRKILRQGLTLFDIFRLAADWDSICREWVTNYKITFELGYPVLRKELAKNKDINEATVNTYLKILSEIPDTLIARKAGLEKAQWVSTRAKKALALGGLGSKNGRKEIERLDTELRMNSNILNPGTTADLSASVLALATLSGYKP